MTSLSAPCWHARDIMSYPVRGSARPATKKSYSHPARSPSSPTTTPDSPFGAMKTLQPAGRVLALDFPSALILITPTTAPGRRRSRAYHDHDRAFWCSGRFWPESTSRACPTSHAALGERFAKQGALFEQRGGSIPAKELRNLVVAGRTGNLHDHAWDAADELVSKMRHRISHD